MIIKINISFHLNISAIWFSFFFFYIFRFIFWNQFRCLRLFSLFEWHTLLHCFIPSTHPPHNIFYPAPSAVFYPRLFFIISFSSFLFCTFFILFQIECFIFVFFFLLLPSNEKYHKILFQLNKIKFFII